MLRSFLTGVDARRGPRLALWGLVLAAGAYLRLWEMGMQIVIDDEWHAIDKLIESGYLGILLSFGHADHCIPLTLLYKLIADTIGLTEWTLRLPELAAGLASVLVLPWLFRPWTRSPERWIFAALLAVSPVLIYYSRESRPYAFIALLEPMALVALFRWWMEGSRQWGRAFFACSVLSAWLQPVSLAFTGAALLWAGLESLMQAWSGRGWRGLERVLLLGSLTVLACALLLLPPLWLDFKSMAWRTGIHNVRPQTLLVAWDLAAGTAYAPVTAALLGLTVFGGWRLWRRSPKLMRYLAFVTSFAALPIILSHAIWIFHGGTFLRYVLPALPLILVCAAIGLASLVGNLAGVVGERRLATARIATPVLAGVVLYLAGPLPAVYSGINQFTSHASFQFDYDPPRNPYVQVMSRIQVPDFYREMAGRAGSGWQVVESPWRLESHFNPLYIYQRVHQLPLRVGFMDGLCAQGQYGEYPRDARGLDFHWFVHLSDLLKNPPARTYLVMHRVPALYGMRELPSMEPCIDAFRQRYGRPWRESPRAVVYRFGARGESQSGPATPAGGG